MGARDSELPPALAALAGTMVTRIMVDDALTLVLQSAGREVRLRIDGAGRLERDGDAVSLAPDEDPAGLGPVLGLLHGRVDSVAVANAGDLALAFRDGARLLALADEHSVSWAVEVAGGSSAACIAEGKVVWK